MFVNTAFRVQILMPFHLIFSHYCVQRPASDNLATGVFPCSCPSFHTPALYENDSLAIALVLAGSLSEARRVEAALVTNYKMELEGGKVKISKLIIRP